MYYAVYVTVTRLSSSPAGRKLGEGDIGDGYGPSGEAGLHGPIIAWGHKKGIGFLPFLNWQWDSILEICLLCRRTGGVWPMQADVH